MIFYQDWFVTPIEVPDELSLAYTITGCRLGCPLCHSKDLWYLGGNPLTVDVLQKQINKQKHISCVLFLGGEYSFEHLLVLNRCVKDNGLKSALYTGLTIKELDMYKYKYDKFDYLKVGRYDPIRGGLDSPLTNQVMYKHGKDITNLFWNKD